MHGLCQKILSTITFYHHPLNICHNPQLNEEEIGEQRNGIKSGKNITNESQIKLLERTNKVKLLTYNMFMRPPLIKTNSSDFKEDRLEEFVKKVLPEFDIICLQEVFTTLNTRKQRLMSYGIRAGFLY